MKRPSVRLVIAAIGILSVVDSDAQTPITPANPTEFKTRDISGGTSAGVGIVARKPQVKQTITINFTAVTPVRVWTNEKGQAMKARLLAFAAPKEGEKGPVEVIRDGKIRFLLANTSKPIDYALSMLSETDRTYIQKLADAARHEDPKAVKTETEAVKEK